MGAFRQLVWSPPQRQATPIAVCPGMALTGASVRAVVSDPAAQVEIQAALQLRYQTTFVLSAIDLSAVAEAVGLCPQPPGLGAFCGAVKAFSQR